MTPTTFRVRRLFGWLPAAFFFALSAIVLAGTPNVGTRVFYVGMTLLTGVWLVRCWRVAVEITESGVTVRGSLRTSRFPWSDIVEATLAPMKSASPLSRRWPYVALALRLHDGRARRFDDISAALARKASISAIVDHINGARGQG